MKLDFEKFPLDVYSNPTSIALLTSISADVLGTRSSGFNLGEFILSSIVKKATGLGGFPFAVEQFINGITYDKAKKCLAGLIAKQTRRVERTPSSLRQEAQVNLMATSCITDYLANVESASGAMAVKSLGKSAMRLLQFRNPLDVLWESALEVTNKYRDICRIYHVAFLLAAYNANPSVAALVKRLIVEAVTDEDDMNKERPILFQKVRNKTLEGNLTNRLELISQKDFVDKALFDEVIKKRREMNNERKPSDTLEADGDNDIDQPSDGDDEYEAGGDEWSPDPELLRQVNALLRKR